MFALPGHVLESITEFKALVTEIRDLLLEVRDLLKEGH